MQVTKRAFIELFYLVHAESCKCAAPNFKNIDTTQRRRKKVCRAAQQAARGLRPPPLLRALYERRCCEQPRCLEASCSSSSFPSFLQARHNTHTMHTRRITMPCVKVSTIEDVKSHCLSRMNGKCLPRRDNTTTIHTSITGIKVVIIGTSFPGMCIQCSRVIRECWHWNTMVGKK